MLNIAIIGAGRIGRVHAESISANSMLAKVVAIVDPFMCEELVRWANSLGITRCLKDYKEVLEDKSVDAVLICSSTNTHSKISLDSIAAGKHIFCEKPVDHDIKKIKLVMDALESSNVKYQVGFNRRFDHNFMAAKDAFDQGKIGKLNVLKVISRDPAPPNIDYVKVSGGLFLDMTIHDFDMVRFISGREVEEVFAYGANLVDPEIGKAGDIDTAIISMKLDNGALATIDNCRRTTYGYDQRLEIFGEEGKILIGNDSCANISISNISGVTHEKPLHFFLERYMHAYIREIKEFLICIKNDSRPSVGIKDGLMDVVVGIAAKRSLETNRPVKIKDILKEYNI